MKINPSPIHSPSITTPNAAQDSTPVLVKIPLKDPRIQESTLSNGIKVYIASHSHPTPHQATLRLVVRVGAIHEKPNERGIAHFVEHSVFQGIPSLPSKAEFDKKILSMGLRPGADENAYTGQQETGYFLDIPLNDPDNLETAIRILCEFASSAELSDSGINAERAPILDELRLRQSVEKKFRHETAYPHLFKGTPLADRFPEGSANIVAECSPNRVRNFYHNWYRPDRMAVIAVGDFDCDNVKGLIESYFGSIPEAKETPPPTPSRTPTEHQETTYRCFFDKDLTRSEILIYALKKMQEPKEIKEAAYASLVQTLTLSMLNKRLEEISLSPTSSFGNAQAVIRKSAPLPYTILSASCMIENSSACLTSLVGELGRIARDGFSEKELKLAISEMEEAIQTQLKECGKDSIDEIAGSCEEHFLNGIPLLNEEAMLYVTEHLLPTVTLADCQAWTSALFPEQGALVCCAGPKSAAAHIDETKLAQAVANAKVCIPSPYNPPLTPKSLFLDKPIPGKIISKEKIEESGLTLYTLSNGATVVVKPTTFENDTFTLRSLNDHGLLNVKDSTERHAFLLGDCLTDLSGIGALNGTSLNHYLAPKQIEWVRFFDDDHTLFKSKGAAKELETALQLYALSFTQPRYEAALFSPLKKRKVEALKHASNKAKSIFATKLRSHNHSNHPLFKSLDPDTLEKISMEQTIAVRSNYLRDPRHFKMSIVGNIDELEVEALLEKYVGSIPLPTSPIQKAPYPQTQFPEGITKLAINDEQGEKCLSILTFPCAPCPSSDINTTRLRGWMTLLLNARLMTKLRTEMQQVYTPSISYNYSKNPQNSSPTLSLKFTGTPTDVEQIEQAALEVLQTFQQEGPSEEEVDSLKIQLRNSRSKLLSSNEFWAAALSTYQVAGIPLSALAAGDNQITQLNPQLFQDEARTLFNLNHYSRATLYPNSRAT